MTVQRQAPAPPPPPGPAGEAREHAARETRPADRATWLALTCCTGVV